MAACDELDPVAGRLGTHAREGASLCHVGRSSTGHQQTAAKGQHTLLGRCTVALAGATAHLLLLLSVESSAMREQEQQQQQEHNPHKDAQLEATQ